MTSQSPFGADISLREKRLVILAARIWERARRGGLPVQPRLHAALAPLECDMLAPLFDSLMTLCQSALGRPIETGSGGRPSEDEKLLVGLIDGGCDSAKRLRFTYSAGSALEIAINSARLMLRCPLERDNPVVSTSVVS